MAGISSKGIYGLTAMYILYQKREQTPIQIREIAEIGKIPQNYLEQLLVLLKKNGLVKSVRGSHGGYMLAKDASEIVIYDILDSLEGTLCLATLDSENPILNLFWSDMKKQIREMFKMKLSDLATYESQLYKSIVYDI